MADPRYRKRVIAHLQQSAALSRVREGNARKAPSFKSDSSAALSRSSTWCPRSRIIAIIDLVSFLERARNHLGFPQVKE
jgi:hypothetical protein